MQIKILIILGLILIGCSSDKVEESKRRFIPEINFVSEQTNFVAGDSISLVFKSDTVVSNLKLLVKNAYGNTLLAPLEIGNKQMQFIVPKNYARLAGPCHWTLLHEDETLSKGKFEVAVNSVKDTFIESYFGPRSITAGNNDFSMLTIAPTDIYDNPLDNDTEVTVKYQFLESINELTITTESFIAWYNVGSTLKSGRILVTSECNGTTSKELTTIVYPANAVNFSISASSAHSFADGNQIITFKSDIIKDEFENTVGDGTLVTFIIKNESNSYLYAIGTTLGGIVEARTLHPDKASKWEIQAFVTGAAESDITEFSFKPAIKDYPVHFSQGNRQIDVGPFESFMKQLIPDGLLLQLDIYNINGEFVETKHTTSKKGVCSILLEEHFLPDGVYNFKIQAAGITKEFTKKIDGDKVK
ncbi:MAG: hypothetical protein AB8B59_00255 [Maribacter sp.]